ncbi:V-type proton ATPase catalytic subunit [Trichinella spiralis]|uniref:V-type proton ATPase catalytic subunit n=1 Tax=Trichinella spiralis TaxID=6334 RepID=A0ABR3KKH9_TRISP
MMTCRGTSSCRERSATESLLIFSLWRPASSSCETRKLKSDLFVGCDQKTAITTHLKCILPYLPKAKYFSVIFSHEEYYPEVQNTYFLNNMKLSQPLQLAQWSVNVKKRLFLLSLY